MTGRGCFGDVHCYETSSPDSALWWTISLLVVVAVVAVVVWLVRR